MTEHDRPAAAADPFLPSETALAECIEEFHRRRARGEEVAAEDFRERLEDLYPEFLHLLAAESAIDEAMTPPVATELPATFGEFTLLRELGRGAVGVVYEAVQRPLGRRVAVKVLRTGFDTDPRARERFSREARACAQVRHENIVVLHGSGEVDGRPYYAMGLVDGEPLSALIRSGRAPKGPALFHGLAGVAGALQVLHEAGIFHRDVKPSNVVVEPGGRMILTDFGLARTALSVTITATGEALGTPLYMSPEQMLGKREAIDGRTDVYGLGATLYEAVAGRPPFKSEDLGELMRLILHQRPRPLREVAPGTPVDVEHVAMKALEKRPEERYASAEAMRSDLLKLAEGRAPQGRPVSAVRHWFRERRTLWVPAAAVLLLAIGAWAWMSNRPGELVFEGFPVGAEVLLDGRPIGRMPVRAEHPPGEVAYRIRLEDFEEVSGTEDLPAAGYMKWRDRLDPKTDAARALLEQQIRMAKKGMLARPGPNRGSSDAVDLGWPQGRVRREDLDRFRIHLYEGAPEGTVVFFRRGEETLFEEALPDVEDVDRALPAALLERLRVGDTVEWGVRTKDGWRTVETEARFEVVAEPPDLAPALAEADRLARDDRGLRAELRGYAYLEHGLPIAAWSEARAVLEGPGAPPLTLGLAAVREEALVRMGLKDTLWETAASRAVREGFPEEEVDRYYGIVEPPPSR